jgi:hypothetical protein
MTIKIKGKLPAAIANGLVRVEELVTTPERPEVFYAIVRFARASLTWDDEKDEWVATLSMRGIEPVSGPDASKLELLMLDARKARTGDEELEMPEELVEPPLDLETGLGQALADAVDEAFEKKKRKAKPVEPVDPDFSDGDTK